MLLSKYRVHSVFVLIFLLFFTGCGGGGSEATNSATVDLKSVQIQGGGSEAIGGKGGLVYEVTNLNDSGEGSFRYGLTSDVYKGKPRVIVFKVGGYIHLQSHILLSNDAYITIAGQTASGDGITIVFPSNPDDSVLQFTNCHDIIMQYIRIRKGGGPATAINMGSDLFFVGDCHDIVVDHCSISWAGDENFGLWNLYPDGEVAPHNISFQWSISAESLRHENDDGHRADSTGFLAGTSKNPETMTDISVHHNLFARNNNRNPVLKGASGDISANIIYNWRWWATGISGGIEVDIVDNLFKAGPAIYDGRPEISYHPADENNSATGVYGDPSIFLSANIGPHNDDPSADAWDQMMHMTDQNWAYPDGVLTRVPREYQRLTPRDMVVKITREDVLELDDVLLKSQGVGASRRLDENGLWQNNRDVIDERIIADYKNGLGDALVDNVDDVGGWPYYINGEYRYVSESEFIANPGLYQLDSGTPYMDSDHDGMPDIWEDGHNLNKNDASDGTKESIASGYTNLEVFLSGLSPN